MKQFCFPVVLALLVISVFLLAGCSGDGQDASANVQTVAASQEVSYRGNNQRTGASNINQLATPPSKVWELAASSRPILSAPLAYHGAVYFGTAEGTFYALDAGSGSVKWKFDAKSSIYSSPVVANNSVFFGCTNGMFYSLNADTGEVQWSYDDSSVVDSSDARDRSIPDAAVVESGTVYFGAGPTFSNAGHIFALNADTGQEIWHFQTGDGKGIDFSPCLYDNDIFFSSLGTVISLDAKTGTQNWVSERQKSISGTPVGYGDLILNYDSFFIYGLDRSTGEIVWKHPHEATCAGDCGLSIRDDVAFYGDKTGFYALDLNNNRLRWENHESQPASTGIPPVFVDNSVCFIDEAANLDVLDQDTGDLLTSYKLQDEFNPSWAVPTPMSLENGVVFVASGNGTVYAIRVGQGI